MPLSRFQKRLQAQPGFSTYDVLREIAARLRAYGGFPPVVPHVGVVIDQVLNEVEALPHSAADGQGSE